MAEMTDQQLERELANRKLSKEQSLLKDPNQRVGNVNAIEGAVGLTLVGGGFASCRHCLHYFEVYAA